jgi:hypothetical protein
MIYCIHHCTGSGGMFLLKVFSEVLGLECQFTMDKDLGHYHNAGLGSWINPHYEICNLGNYNFTYHKNAKLYYTHDHEILKKVIADHPKIKVVLIRHDEDDHASITKQAMAKAWPTLWTKKEYDRWASTGADLPPYHKDNLKDPKVYKMLHEQLNLLTIEWYQNLDHGCVSDHIDYKTVMGLDGNDLSEKIHKITGLNVEPAIKQMIADYQIKNKELYFNG